MRRIFKRCGWRGRKGATAVEYALILALVAVVAIAIASAIGQHAKNTFGRANTTIANVTAADASATVADEQTRKGEGSGKAKASGHHHGKTQAGRKK